MPPLLLVLLILLTAAWPAYPQQDRKAARRPKVGLVLAGVIPGDEAARRTWTRRVAMAWPLVALMLAVAIREPVGMVLASGVAQAVMLGALAVAVLWFRYRHADPRLTPTPAFDVLLWVSACSVIRHCSSDPSRHR